MTVTGKVKQFNIYLALQELVLISLLSMNVAIFLANLNQNLLIFFIIKLLFILSCLTKNLNSPSSPISRIQITRIFSACVVCGDVFSALAQTAVDIYKYIIYLFAGNVSAVSLCAVLCGEFNILPLATNTYA